MKCAIIGASIIPSNLTEKHIEQLELLGKWLAEHKIEILTGACDGVPYIVGKACIQGGGKVKGFSPATNLNDHINQYKHPVDGCTSFFFLDSSNYSANTRFLIRSIPLINEADVVICVAGNWGTLNELTLGVISGKKHIVLTGFGGICDDFSCLYQKLSRDCDYSYGEKFYFTHDIEEVYNLLMQFQGL